MKLLFSFVVCLAVALSALFWVFPWSVEQDGFNFPWQMTLISYVVLAVIMAVLAGILTPLVFRRILTTAERGVKAGAFLGLGNLGCLFGLVALFSGPGLFLNIPGTRVNGIFLAEWNFMSFFFEVGVPYSLITSALTLWLTNKGTECQAR